MKDILIQIDDVIIRFEGARDVVIKRGVGWKGVVGNFLGWIKTCCGCPTIQGVDLKCDGEIRSRKKNLIISNSSLALNDKGLNITTKE